MRVCLLLLAGALASLAAQSPKPETVEGKLTQRSGRPAVEAAGRTPVALEGDEPTQSVLRDKRLEGMEIQAKGRYLAPDRFQVDPIHTRAVMVRRDGHLKLITYWCELCSIRAYTPGRCACCQEETTVDLRDPDAK